MNCQLCSRPKSQFVNSIIHTASHFSANTPKNKMSSLQTFKTFPKLQMNSKEMRDYSRVKLMNLSDQTEALDVEFSCLVSWLKRFKSWLIEWTVHFIALSLIRWNGGWRNFSGSTNVFKFTCSSGKQRFPIKNLGHHFPQESLLIAWKNSLKQTDKWDWNRRNARVEMSE